MTEQHVAKEWFNLALRLQLAAKRLDGPGIISISILVGEGQLPAAWSEPSTKKLEPKFRSQDAIMAIAKQLCSND